MPPSRLRSPAVALLCRKAAAVPRIASAGHATPMGSGPRTGSFVAEPRLSRLQSVVAGPRRLRSAGYPAVCRTERLPPRIAASCTQRLSRAGIVVADRLDKNLHKWAPASQWSHKSDPVEKMSIFERTTRCLNASRTTLTGEVHMRVRDDIS